MRAFIVVVLAPILHLLPVRSPSVRNQYPVKLAEKLANRIRNLGYRFEISAATYPRISVSGESGPRYRGCFWCATTQSGARFGLEVFSELARIS